MCEAALLPSWSCYLCFNLSLIRVTLWKTKSCQSSKNSLKGSHCYFGPDVGATWMFSALTIIFFYTLQLQKYSPLLPQMLAESKFSKFGHLCFQFYVSSHVKMLWPLIFHVCTEQIDFLFHANNHWGLCYLSGNISSHTHWDRQTCTTLP